MDGSDPAAAPALSASAQQGPRRGLQPCHWSWTLLDLRVTASSGSLRKEPLAGIQDKGGQFLKICQYNPEKELDYDQKVNK